MIIKQIIECAEYAKKIPVTCLDDDRLTLSDIGLLSILYRNPKTVSNYDIEVISQCSNTSLQEINESISHLKECGYIVELKKEEINEETKTVWILTDYPPAMQF